MNFNVGDTVKRIQDSLGRLKTGDIDIIIEITDGDMLLFKDDTYLYAINAFTLVKKKNTSLKELLQ